MRLSLLHVRRKEIEYRGIENGCLIRRRSGENQLWINFDTVCITKIIQTFIRSTENRFCFIMKLSSKCKLQTPSWEANSSRVLKFTWIARYVPYHSYVHYTCCWQTNISDVSGSTMSCKRSISNQLCCYITYTILSDILIYIIYVVQLSIYRWLWECDTKCE